MEEGTNCFDKVHSERFLGRIPVHGAMQFSYVSQPQPDGFVGPLRQHVAPFEP